MAKPRDVTSHKAVVRAAFAAAGHKRVAALLDRSASQVYAYDDPAEAAEASFAQLRKVAQFMPASAAVLASDFATLAGGAYVPLAIPHKDFASLMALSGAEAGDLFQTVFSCIGDGERCARDNVQIHAAIRDLMAVLVALERHVVDLAPLPGVGAPAPVDEAPPAP